MELPPFPLREKGGDPMKTNNVKRYYLYRIRLEKLKQRTWLLVVLARLLLFLLS